MAYFALPPAGSQRDIWTIPYRGLSAGEKPVPVTQDAAVDFNPVWGPDGRTLYFLSNRNGAMNLWRVPIDEATGRARSDWHGRGCEKCPGRPYDYPGDELVARCQCCVVQKTFV